MNDLIKEFLNQSTKNVYSDKGGWIDVRVDYEKFADLIVQECIQTIRDNTPAYTPSPDPDDPVLLEDWDKGYLSAMMDCEHHIKEHFGVE